MIFCKPKYDGGFKMSEYLPEGKLILTQDNINTLHSFSLLSDAKKEGKILEARACVCDAEHNLIVDLGIMKVKKVQSVFVKVRCVILR